MFYPLSSLLTAHQCYLPAATVKRDVFFICVQINNIKKSYADVSLPSFGKTMTTGMGKVHELS